MPSTPDDDDVYSGEFTLNGARRWREHEINRSRAEWLEALGDGSGVDSNAEVIAACETACAAAVLVADAKLKPPSVRGVGRGGRSDSLTQSADE